jgi:hypothetical protein
VKNRIRRLTRAALLAAVAAVGTGCTGSPGGGPVADRHPVFDEAALRATALEFWEVKEQPSLHRALPAPRVAIVEFSLQFVPSDPPVDIAAGIRVELPGLLYGSFVDILQEHGRSVKPLDQVSAALDAQDVKGTRFEEIRLAAAAASGLPWFPVNGLRVLDEKAADLEPSLMKVLQDVGVDYALQARLRMGVRDGCLTIEPGSTLKAWSPSGSTLLVSRKVLASAARLGAGSRVASREFAIQAHDLFHPYVARAIIASGGCD